MLGQEVNNYIKNQFIVRQKINSNTPTKSKTQIKLQNNQSTWIKMASGVSIDQGENGEERLKALTLDGANLDNLKGFELAKKFVLFNGVSSYKKDKNPESNWGSLTQKQGISTNSFLNSSGAYSKSDFGTVPMPGIIDFNIKSLNRGSIKKATIKLKIHSKTQFEVFDLLYLRLGYTVLIEFGNNIFTPDGENIEEINKTIIEDQKEGFFSDNFTKTGSYLKLLESLEEYRTKYNGNYGGFLGKISNFNWTIDELGSYDISLELLSLGDIIESLQTKIPNGKRFLKFLSAAISQDGEIPEGKNVSDKISAMLFAYEWINKDLKTDPITANEEDSANIRTLGYKMSNTNSSDPSRIEYDKIVLDCVVGPYISDDTRYYKVADTVGTNKRPAAYTIDLHMPEKIMWSKEVSYNENKVGKFRDNKSCIEARWGYLKLYFQAWLDRKKDSNGNYTVKYVAEGAGKQADHDWREGDENDAWPRIKFVEKSTTKKIPNPCQDFGEDGDGFKTTQSEPEHYIRLGVLLKYINNNIIPKIVLSEEESIKLCNINFQPDYYEAGMFTLPNQISLDPRVCIVNNKVTNPIELTSWEYYKGLKPFREIDFSDDELNIRGIGRTDERKLNVNRAYIENIYLNHNFLRGLLQNDGVKGEVYLYKFFKGICDGVNKALGGINNLEPVIDETLNLLTLADLTPIPGQIQQFPSPPYKLNLFGFDKDGDGNFIRKLDIKTSITPDYAKMISIGSTASGYVKGINGTAFSKWNSGLIDRFKEKIVAGDIESQEPIPDEENDPNSAFFPNEAAEIYYNEFLTKKVFEIIGSVEQSGTELLKPLNDQTISSNLSKVTEFYKFALAYKTIKSGDKSVAGGIGFIPFKLNFTIDGLDGIKIYNTIHIESSFLPQAYGQTLDFIITGVDHSIKDNDWETSITTLVQPKTNIATVAIPNYQYIYTSKVQEVLRNAISSFFDSAKTFLKGPTPSTPSRSVEQAREQDPDLGVGTLGTKGPTHADLPPKGLTSSQIQNKSNYAKSNINNSTYFPQIQSSPEYKNLLERIVKIASSYVGQSEIDENTGWFDPLYQEKFETSPIAWKPGSQWCNFFTNLVWREAYTTGNALVGPNPNKSIVNDYSTLLKGGGWARNSVSCFKDGVSNSYGIGSASTLGKHQKHFFNNVRTISQVRKDPKKYFVVPGSLVIYSISHIGIVISVNAKSGKYTTFKTIEGNTSTGDRRDGGGTVVVDNSFSSTTASHFIIPPTSLITGFS